MSFDEVHKEIDRIDATDAGWRRKHVTILGAGMAGLVAAYELSRLGHKVTLIEAQQRVGGRVWTCRFKNGDYHELGAMRIPRVHAFTRYYANRLGLRFRRFVNHHEDKDTLYHFRGVTSTHADYKVRLLPSFHLGERDLAILNAAPDVPAVALMSVLDEAVKAVEGDPASVNALFARGPMTALVEELDSQSLRDYLSARLQTNDALELVGAATALEVWWDKAASMFVREEIALKANKAFDEIVGGADLLPSAILAELRKRPNVEVRLDTEVLAIHNRTDQVQLVLRTPSQQDGNGQNVERVDAELVICTIPFPVLRRLVLTGLPHDKQAAIRNLHYASSTKVVFSCRERFWETEYNIFGGGSQTDLINRQIYYPSDSSEQLDIQTAPTASSGLHKSFTMGERTKPGKVQSRSGALVGSYVWDADARRLGSLPPAERARVVAKCVAEIHPEILEDDMILESASISWDEFDWAAGAFCFMRPGDLRNYYAATIRPEGRLHFAGEHCSLDQAWIQGAITSSLRAVLGVVAIRD